MALGTVVDLMPPGQRKKQVVGAASRPKPARSGNVVAILTIGGIARRCVVGHGSRRVFFKVAIDAIVPDAVKPYVRFRKVALPAIHYRMHAEQREAVFLVQRGDVVHQPMLRGMASGAVVTHGHLV